MRSFAISVSAVLGLMAMVAGVVLVLNGLLPLRSHGPNPSWLEVVCGLLLGIAGFLLRHFTRRAPANPSGICMRAIESVPNQRAPLDVAGAFCLFSGGPWRRADERKHWA